MMDVRTAEYVKLWLLAILMLSVYHTLPCFTHRTAKAVGLEVDEDTIVVFYELHNTFGAVYELNACSRGIMPRLFVVFLANFSKFLLCSCPP